MVFGSRQGQDTFPVLHGVQTGSEARPAYYPMGSGGYSPRVKHPGREASESCTFSTLMIIVVLSSNDLLAIDAKHKA
jgi:hypothetical protein